MKKKILLYLGLFFFISLAIIFFLAYVYSEYTDIKWLSASLGVIFIPMITYLIKWIVNIIMNYKKTWRNTLKKLIKNKNIQADESIRISFAYLFRIKYNGKYLLVKNARSINKYQPVGGAYKCSQNEKLVLTNNDFNVLDDDFIPIDETSKDDYRMRVPAKNLKRFIKRFDTTNERENLSDLSREFKEELFTTEIFKSADFNEINYRYLGRHFTDIVYSDYNKCYELLLADIVELIPTKNQEKILSTSQKANNRKFLWANDYDISSHGIKKGTKKMTPTITDHSYKILPSTKLSTPYKNKKNLIISVKI